MSFSAYIRLPGEDFIRVFPPRFSTMSQAKDYAEHKLDFWPQVSQYGYVEAVQDANCTWRNGKLRPVSVNED